MKIKLNVLYKNRTLFIGDLFLIVACVMGSFVLRLNLGQLFLDNVGRALVMLLIALIIKPLVYFGFGLYRRMWEYASTRELMLITIAVTAASICVSLVIVLIQMFGVFAGFSRSILVIDWLLSILAVGGLRFSLKVLAENQLMAQESSGKIRRVLIIGAGDAGALVVREIQKSSNVSLTPSAHLQPVGFIDDDPGKKNQEIHGVKVLGTLKDMAKIVTSFRVDEVFIAIPSASGQVVRIVTDICRQKGIPYRTMPSIHELIGGKVSVNRLREVEIADLLRRETARIDHELVGLSLGGRRVLVTGAGGSIGRELCRQIARWGPAEMVLLGHGENSIFEIFVELGEDFPSLPIHPVIADIRDTNRLDQVFDSHHPQVVFHTAAHKHVPLMENNISEAVTNNVVGTYNVVNVALENQVDRLVLISSDKAVCPSSVYGATKRLAEMIVLDAAHRSGRAFSVVRFGNVLGSRGSIVPIFKRQIAHGGPITITHPDMKRYLMTIPEAVHLVLQASAMGQHGETFVLNMGEQVRILDLAEDLIRLSGLEPGKDIEIVFTGIRPGEKLSEALWDKGADYTATEHPDILRLADEQALTRIEIQAVVEKLTELAKKGCEDEILQVLDESIPGAAMRSVPPPDLTAVI